jgi:hypothetical protein
MEKFSDVKAYLTLPESKRDIDEGIQLYAKYYKNKTYLQYLQRRRKHDDVNYKLEKLLKDNDIAIPEIDNNVEPSGTQGAATGKPDATATTGQGKEPDNSGEGGASAPKELSDEVKAYIEAESESWKAIYKESGADHAIMVDLANSLESGESSAKLAELAASIDAAFSEKMQVHWNNIEFAKANNAIPVASEEKKESALDVAALSDVELLKKRATARGSVSKYKKDPKDQDKLTEWQSKLDALQAEVEKRDLK